MFYTSCCPFTYFIQHPDLAQTGVQWFPQYVGQDLGTTPFLSRGWRICVIWMTFLVDDRDSGLTSTVGIPSAAVQQSILHDGEHVLGQGAGHIPGWSIFCMAGWYGINGCGCGKGCCRRMARATNPSG